MAISYPTGLLVVLHADPIWSVVRSVLLFRNRLWIRARSMEKEIRKEIKKGAPFETKWSRICHCSAKTIRAHFRGLSSVCEGSERGAKSDLTGAGLELELLLLIINAAEARQACCKFSRSLSSSLRTYIHSIGRLFLARASVPSK